MAFYFEKYETRTPPKPIPYSFSRELLWQFLATINLVLGAWYIHWRWTASLNMDALWFAYPLVIAESLAYFGLILFTFNLWKVKDVESGAPPSRLKEVTHASTTDRPISVDIFFPSYDEAPELVKLSLLDAQKIHYPHDITINIYLLDDGRRDAMEALAKATGVHYITRSNNIGFKAGNLRNAMEQTSGDFIVICDADTRPFPTMLEHTLGYFRDPDVAWVQTPQWFFDLPEGKNLTQAWQQKYGWLGKWIAIITQKLFGKVEVGGDPFVNNPQMFYDIIQRRRNWANASFCCGAGSIHRRDAVMQSALIAFGDNLAQAEESKLTQLKKLTNEQDIDDSVVQMVRQDLVEETELTPYKFHVSEDIYTSMVLHGDKTHHWKSILHPQVESKMLSPQDLQTWLVQRFKYAGGTIDIALNDNPLFRKGMSFSQKVMYASTMWSYFGALWNVVFILAPVIYFFSGVAPVSAYSGDFYKHIIPFLIMNELAFMVGTWGIPGYQAKASFISFFSVNLKAIFTVLKGEKIAFPTTPKERQEGNFAHLVWPQIGVVVLTVIGFIYCLVSYLLFNNQLAYTLNAVLINSFWAANNVLAMMGMIRCAFWQPQDAA
ncbi:glycosyltransferase [Thalassotalea euphylliae]|uniref:Glycosyltransferase n=1 Tax=Thalassotalea euphylliae TaxID=1655234 RepID=A0A3E0TLD7_9GAMM|nr:cellulose synthase catalytic subunit [Thalassotalea euphylliae]REL25336.1 glycosyltransferase [Thalassotalea euphylliae]